MDISFKSSLGHKRMTPIQLQMLVDILSVNPELISGKLTANFTKADRKNKWQALATLLNSKELGPQKDADKWRKSWTDLKFAIRTKASKIELEGGADLMCERLSDLEKRVLQMIGEFSTGDNGEVDEGESNSMTDSSNSKELILPDTVAPQMPATTHFLGNNYSNKKDIIEIPCVKISDDEDDYEESGEYDDYNNDDDDDEESVDNNLNHSAMISSGAKRRRISSESSYNIPAVTSLQKHMAAQTAALNEQTNLLKDISKSLQVIAKAMQNR